MNHKTDSASALTTEQLAEKALAATVYLEMKDSTGTTLSFGSGFFVKPNQIATNFHVIEDKWKGTAKLVGKDTRYEIEGIVAIDEENDLAVLNVTAPGVAPLPLGDSDTVKRGTKVYVDGNPKGLIGTFSDGIISRLESHPKKRLQMTAPISKGSSGGPVLNSKGEVIGISVAVHGDPDAQNLNFAIPSNALKALLAKAGPATLSQNSQSIFAETYFLWGFTKYELGLYHEAISDYDKAIRLNPGDAFAYLTRGLAKAALKQYTAAIADYDTAIRLKPDYALAYRNRGAAKANLMKQYAAAIVDYTQAIRLNPDDAATYYNRGQAKAALKQYFAAVADYDTAICLNPNFALAYHNQGQAKAALKQYAAAIVDYTQAIRLKPDYALAYYKRGQAKDNLEQYAAAIDDYTQAIRLKPDDVYAYYKRGQAKAALKQYFAAIADYDTAIRLDPDHADAYYFRGSAKALLGWTSEAKQDLWTAWALAVQAGDAEFKVHIEGTLRLLE